MKDFGFREDFAPEKCGKSPSQVDTPGSDHGQVFINDEESSSPTVEKQSWEIWIDNLPDLYQSSPELQSFRKRRPSTPLIVVLKQLWVKFGGARIDGIDPETGNLLPDGPYKEWAHENEIMLMPTITANKPEKIIKNGSATSCLKEDLPKERETIKVAEITEPEKTEITEISKAPDLINESQNSSSSQNSARCSKYWGISGVRRKRIEDEVVWDFGKPFLLEKMVKNYVEHETKKPKLISETPSVSSSVLETEETAQEKEKIPNRLNQRRLFVLSSISASLREKLARIIKNLGGEVSHHFDPSSTHFIIETPVRSEKLLCAIASGKWILHTSYLTQCYQSNKFLPEEDFEYGNKRSLERLPLIMDGSIESELAEAAHRWRINTSRAFESFKVVIVCTSQNKNKYSQFQRILETGGALVLAQKLILDATHVFWDESSTLPIPKKRILDRSILLLKPIYLGDYLTKIPTPDPKLYIAY